MPVCIDARIQVSVAGNTEDFGSDCPRIIAYTKRQNRHIIDIEDPETNIITVINRNKHSNPKQAAVVQ